VSPGAIATVAELLAHAAALEWESTEPCEAPVDIEPEPAP
jgi:hypothetical protein